MKKVAFYGGSFDPLHNGHLTIARKLTEIFGLDEFVFIPAFHAPHKKGKTPTSALHRFAMLCLATENEKKIRVSTVELDAPEKPFTFETQVKLKSESPDAEIFFVIGADSWAEINTWREWEKVLTLTNIIVVTRPNYDIGFSHVTEEIRERIVDLRKEELRITNYELRETRDETNNDSQFTIHGSRVYITDAVNLNVSATEIRRKIRAGENNWRELVTPEVAKYIENYELYI
ncbi:MAG TPA: nicotinate-nucleotide adenylyltransferase [Pyrinomonadaceae bacterium]|nr:nicotinate-nucleotide adenylyltransferase [Pyrinomonadaceae bacterium]